MSRNNAIMLLVSFLITFAAVKALPVATTALDATAMANAVDQLVERKLIITSCGILGNSCAFATSDDGDSTLPTLSNSVATGHAKVDHEANITNATLAVTSVEETPAVDGSDTELAVRDPKLIITSCGILGNSCAFVVPTEADGSNKVDTTTESQVESVKMSNEDPAVKEAANHIIERMSGDAQITANENADKVEAALPNAFMMLNAVIG